MDGCGTAMFVSAHISQWTTQQPNNTAHIFINFILSLVSARARPNQDEPLNPKFAWSLSGWRLDFLLRVTNHGIVKTIKSRDDGVIKCVLHMPNIISIIFFRAESWLFDYSAWNNLFYLIAREEKKCETKTSVSNYAWERLWNLLTISLSLCEKTIWFPSHIKLHLYTHISRVVLQTRALWISRE